MVSSDYALRVATSYWRWDHLPCLFFCNPAAAHFITTPLLPLLQLAERARSVLECPGAPRSACCKVTRPFWPAHPACIPPQQHISAWGDAAPSVSCQSLRLLTIKTIRKLFDAEFNETIFFQFPQQLMQYYFQYKCQNVICSVNFAFLFWLSIVWQCNPMLLFHCYWFLSISWYHVLGF